ncbi:polysaccharide biosynthesis/export family protein [Bacteroides sp. AN502(2024)]|uniref:polysaccharide biosynthesis/export family protein n=1 Tax=Bacteroides sp. AN502(2024) TaxID=3160599 RepID=UPI003519048E
MLKKKITRILLLSMVLLLGGCSASHKIAYMQDVRSDVRREVATVQVTAQPGDKISIVVNSKNPELADMFNLPIMAHRIGQPMNNSYNYNQQVSSYTVDSNGNIDFPILGELHVEGLKREKIASYIKNELVRKNQVKDAVVIVEFLNMGVSVMGEVNRPGRFSIDRDYLTLLDALSMAGDLTIHGKRENVLVTRRENGTETHYRVNLCDSKSLSASPVYYLHQNDQVYVEPNDVRARQSTVNGNNVRSASFWMSLASVLATISVLIFK